MAQAERKSIWSWAMYDWANSAYATVVMAGFFPIFFKQYWSADLPVTESTYYLGMSNSIASLIVAAMSPLLGAVADHLGRRKGFLLIFACMGAVMTGALFWIEQGQWQIAALVYVTSIIGFSGANLFYDSLLNVVAGPERVDRISALGFALGYLGGGVLFALLVWMTLSPDTFGLADAGQAVRIAFLITAAWWLLFTIPLLVFVRDRPATRGPDGAVLASSLRQLRTTLGRFRQLPQAWLFLVAYWLYIDGVDTIIRMAVDYGLAIGLASNDLITALLITQFIGFPSAIVFGRIGERLGPRRGILIAVTVYVLVTVQSIFMYATWQFYLLACVIGLVQGGVQALSRSLYTRLIPARQSAEFFGFYNMLGKFAAVLGPAMVGWATVMSGSNRIGVTPVLLLLAVGGFLLLRVDIAKGVRDAAAYR